VFLYYITDRRQLSDDRDRGLKLLLERIELAARARIDAIQIREKDLSARELLDLSRRAVEIVRRVPNLDTAQPGSRILINSRIDVAVACGANGVHLRSDDISPAEARNIFVHAGTPAPIIAVSCHSRAEVEIAEGEGASFCVFGPVFEKSGSPAGASGITDLRRVCLERRQAKPPMPVLALGGITLENAAACIQAGATGIAAIRLFQSGNIERTIAHLRSLAAIQV
jgi:thiamine-phosphate pyrophosphorylase